MIISLRAHLKQLSSLRRRLAAHYEGLRSNDSVDERADLLLGRLAEEERRMADNLASAARRSHIALGAWIHTPRDFPGLPDVMPTDLDELMEAVRPLDEAMLAQVDAPVHSPSQRVLDFIAAVRDTLATRAGTYPDLAALPV